MPAYFYNDSGITNCLLKLKIKGLPSCICSSKFYKRGHLFREERGEYITANTREIMHIEVIQTNMKFVVHAKMWLSVNPEIGKAQPSTRLEQV